MFINRKKKAVRSLISVLIAVSVGMALFVGLAKMAERVSKEKSSGEIPGIANDEAAGREAAVKRIDTIINHLNPTRPDTLGTVILGKYKGIELDPVEKTLVKDEDMEAYIHNALAEYREESAEAKFGDYVNIDFIGYRNADGEAFEGGAAVDYEVLLGSKTLVEGFEESLIGAKKGSVLTIKLKISKDNGNKEIAGKDVTFKVNMNDIEREPVLTDELVNLLTGGKQKHVAEYKKMVNNLIQNEYDYRDRTILYYNAAVKAMENSKFRPSEAAIEWEMDQYIINYNQMFDTGTRELTLSSMIALSGHTYEDFRKTLRPTCIQSLNKKILLNAIADAEQIVVTMRDMEDYADAVGISVTQLEQDLGSGELKERVRQDLAAKFIVNHAVINP